MAMEADESAASGGSARGETLPTKHLIPDVPVDYHGPVDFPCFGCGLRSLAAYHGELVSKNSLMFQGALRFSFPYLRGVGFSSWAPVWARYGYNLDISYAARATGIDLEILDHGPDRPWAVLWNEWKARVAAGEPVYFCTRDANILWGAAGDAGPPHYDGDDRRNVAHCVVLVGYDEDRGVALIHDNWYFYRNTKSGTDVPVYEVPIDAVERALAERRVPPPFVYRGRRDDKPDIGTILDLQARIVRGTAYNAVFAPPELPEVALGYRAFAAAANDLDETRDHDDALKNLLVGFDRFLRTPWWLGVDGQVARAAWLSGVAAVTGNRDVEAAAAHLDNAATELARAADEYKPLRDELRKDRPNRDVVDIRLSALVEFFRNVAEEEWRAAERLESAARALDSTRMARAAAGFWDRHPAGAGRSVT